MRVLALRSFLLCRKLRLFDVFEFSFCPGVEKREGTEGFLPVMKTFVESEDCP